MIKNFTRIEHVIGDKEFHFVCTIDAHIDACLEAVNHFQKIILDKRDEIMVALEKQKAEQEAKEKVIETSIEPTMVIP